MVHSTAVPGAPAKNFLSSWNTAKPGGREVCVHGFVDDTGAYQTLPWTIQAWHCGGSGNQTAIGVEVNKQVRNRIIKKRIHVKVEHVLPSKCRKQHLDRVKQNDAIKAATPVVCEEMPIEKARERGAIGVFGDKYGEMVKVYTIGDVSCEICGGPHVSNTSELQGFKIKKEESSAAGIRRIKAVVGKFD